MLGAITLMALLLPSRAAAATTFQLVDHAVTTYEVIPSAGIVKVTIDVELSLQATTGRPCGQPEFVEDGSAVTAFCAGRDEGFNWYDVVVDDQETSLAASSDGGKVTLADLDLLDPGFKYFKLTFTPPREYGTRTLHVAYELHAAAAGSRNPIRVGEAYSYTCIRGNGWRRGELRLVFPSAFQWNVLSGDELAEAAGGKKTVLEVAGAQPYTLDACVALTDTDAMTSTEVDTGGRTFTIYAWPEDRSWTTDVAAAIRRDIPALEASIGSQPPVTQTIGVMEYSTTQLGDYDGFYVDTSRKLYLSESLHQATIAHELSHMWFNTKTIQDTWLYEGLARYMERVAGPGEFDSCPQLPVYPGIGLPDLLDWQYLDSGASTQEILIVDYQYEASCYLVTQAATRLGDKKVGEVLQAGFKHEIAYVGRPKTETIGTGLLTWQEWLDLIDERGGGSSDLDAMQQLFAEAGVTADQQTMAARSAARSTYHRLVADAGDWRMPIAIREPMATWQFDDAEAVMQKARQIVDERNELAALLPDASVAGDPDLRNRFETAKTADDLSIVLATMRSKLDTARHIATAQDLVHGRRDPLVTIGLAGENLNRLVGRAIEQLKAGDLEAADATANEIIGRMHDARNQGLLRAAPVVAASLLAFGILMALLLRRAMRRRRALAAAIAAGHGPAPASAARYAEELAAWGLQVPPMPPAQGLYPYVPPYGPYPAPPYAAPPYPAPPYAAPPYAAPPYAAPPYPVPPAPSPAPRSDLDEWREWGLEPQDPRPPEAPDQPR